MFESELMSKVGVRGAVDPLMVGFEELFWLGLQEVGLASILLLRGVVLTVRGGLVRSRSDPKGASMTIVTFFFY